jgi:hypothetical protein
MPRGPPVTSTIWSVIHRRYAGAPSGARAGVGGWTSSRLFVNHFLVRSPEELDDTFRDWVRESSGVGQGDHLRP